MAGGETGSIWDFEAGEEARFKTLTWECERGLKGGFRENALSDQLPRLFGEDKYLLEVRAYWTETSETQTLKYWAPLPHRVHNKPHHRTSCCDTFLEYQNFSLEVYYFLVA